MNRRAKLQLRLQETVEGLSVAISIPVVVASVALGVRQVRKMIAQGSS